MAVESRELSLAEVIPGSVLADDVPDPQGGVLLARGTVATEAILGDLRRRQVSTLCVLVDNPAATDEKAPCRENRRLQHIFRHAGDNPAARELFVQLSEYRSSRQMGGD